MKMLLPFALILFLSCCAPLQTQTREVAKGKDFKVKTSAGISIKASQEVVKQYEAKWGPWADIDWNRVDQYFMAFNKFYEERLKAKKLEVIIGKWDLPCIDCVYGNYPDCIYPRGEAMPSAYGCIQGIFLYPTNTAKIHMGKDSGKGADGFCKTAFGHELNHWALKQMKNPCWQKEQTGNCAQYWRSDKQLGLCP